MNLNIFQLIPHKKKSHDNNNRVQKQENETKFHLLVIPFHLKWTNLHEISNGTF
jgi:hypothetical protein